MEVWLCVDKVWLVDDTLRLEEEDDDKCEVMRIAFEVGIFVVLKLLLLMFWLVDGCDKTRKHFSHTLTLSV